MFSSHCIMLTFICDARWRNGGAVARFFQHHMFANVPCYNLKSLHAEIAHDMPTPRTLVGAWKEMRTTWLKQQEDPSYEYDTPIPAATKEKTDAMEAQRKEAANLGGIAPSESF